MSNPVRTITRVTYSIPTVNPMAAPKHSPPRQSHDMGMPLWRTGVNAKNTAMAAEYAVVTCEFASRQIAG